MKHAVTLSLFAFLAMPAIGQSDYVCLEQSNGELGPRLDCSDYEAERAAAAIGIYLKKGRIDEALGLLEILVTAKPFNSAYRKMLVENKLAYNRLEGLRAHCETLAKLDPNSDEVRILHAKVLNEVGQSDEAIALLSKHIQNHASSASMRRLRAQIYEKRGDAKLAQMDWRILERMRLPTEERLHRLISGLEQKQYEEVRKELEPMADPDSGAADPMVVGLLMDALMGLKAYDKAERAGTQALLRWPEATALRVKTAKALIEQKKYDEALQHLSRALSYQPGDLSTIYQMSRVYILQERYDLAGRALATLSHLDRKNDWTVRAQAELWNHLGEHASAKATLAARSLDPMVLKQASEGSESLKSDSEEREVSSMATPCAQHYVQRGETLETIALRYFDSRQAWTSIIGVNSKTISHPNKIREGMVLWIPKNKETGQCED